MENVREVLGCGGEDEEVSKELLGQKDPGWERLLARLDAASGEIFAEVEKKE